MKEIYATLDIGSTTLKLIVAEVVSANINVLFSKKIPSHGVVKGAITDSDAVVTDIKALVHEAEQELDTTIRAIGLIIPSKGARIYQGDGITKVNAPSDKIAVEDVLRTLKLSTRFERGKKEEIVCTIPIRYYLDTKSMSKIPLGMKSASLKAETMIITADQKPFYSYLMVVEKAGLQLLDVCISSYAAALEAFDEAYIQEGGILIDIGYHTSTISFFEDGYLKYLAQASQGGYDLTKAIANAWQIPMDKAELYKIKYGTCDKDVGEEDVIHTSVIEGESKSFTQKDLSMVLRDTVKEMMNVIKTKIDVINDGRNYEIVIVGGGGELPYLEEVAEAILGRPVRCYRPETIGARDMSYVPALGMMYFLNDRKELIGEDNVSLALPELTSTEIASIKIHGVNQVKKEETGGIGKWLKKFFGDEEE